MPEISRFYGIIITMFISDHCPPHFHVKYSSYSAIITIGNGIIRGEMPIRIVKLVTYWAELHQTELKANWENLQNGKSPMPIEPLK